MLHRKIFAILVAVAALGVGVTLVRTEFRAHSSTATTDTRSPAPTTNPSAQLRAEQKSEEQTVKSDCEALRKMGVADKDCPPDKGNK